MAFSLCETYQVDVPAPKVLIKGAVVLGKPPVEFWKYQTIVKFALVGVADNLIEPGVSHIVSGETVGGSGNRFTVTVTAVLESDVQPLIVHATLYDFVAVGLTVILVPVKPSVQANIPPAQALATKVVDLPIQIATEPGVIVGLLGVALTVTVAISLESEVQPESVHATT